MPFHFLEAWALALLSVRVVEKAWEENWKDGIESHQLRRSLFKTSKAFMTWNKDHFGYAHTRIKLLEKEFGTLQLNINGEKAQICIIQEELQTYIV